MDVEEEILRKRFSLSMRSKIVAIGVCYMAVSTLALLVSVDEITHAVFGEIEDAINDEGPGEQPPAVRLVTFFRDDFKHEHAGWSPDIRGTGTVTTRNGKVFLNISSDVGASGAEHGVCFIEGKPDRWLYASVEIRLRWSQDAEGFESANGTGGVTKCWGFGDNQGNSLSFMYHSPSSQILRGFRAFSEEKDEIVLLDPLEGIDLGEWHNYTVHWRQGNGTLLIDGVVVASTQRCPDTPMSLRIGLGNDVWKGGLGEAHSPEGLWDEVIRDEWIEVEYVHAYMPEDEHKRYAEEVSGMRSAAEAAILGAELRGLNTTKMRGDLASADGVWDKHRYYPADSLLGMSALAQLSEEDLDEVFNLFNRASEKIRDLDPEEREALIMKANLHRAEEAWNEYDFALVVATLQRIVEDDKA